MNVERVSVALRECVVANHMPLNDVQVYDLAASIVSVIASSPHTANPFGLAFDAAMLFSTSHNVALTDQHCRLLARAAIETPRGEYEGEP